MRRLPPFLALLALAGCADNTVCTPPQELSEIPLLRIGQDEIVPVEIDGEPAGLMLDTGAAYTTVTPQAARELNLTRPVTIAALSGIGKGIVITPVVRIDRLKVGATTVVGASTPVVTLSNAPLSRFPVYGLIGRNILSHWDLDIDAARDSLRLYAPQRCGAPTAPWHVPALGVRTSLTHLLNVDTAPVSLDGQAIHALVDTGSPVSLVSRDAAGLSERALANDPAGFVFGLGFFTVPARVHRFADLTIGGRSFGPVTVPVAESLPHGLDMLLGEDFLHRHRVYIAYRSHRLLISPASP